MFCFVLKTDLSFHKNWVVNGQPIVFWLSSFFSSQGLLTGVIQNYARMQKTPIDLLDLDFHFTNKEPDYFTEHPAEGVYVYGLFMVGARWCRKTSLLQESQHKVIFDRLPVIRLKPIVKSNADLEEATFYRCPVFKTSIRQGTISATGNSTNFVLTIHVPTDRDEAHWIIRSR